MKCIDIMKSDIESVAPTDTIDFAAKKMRERNVGFLPVCDEGNRVIGTLTDRDIVLRVVAEGQSPRSLVRDAMTREVVSCAPGEDLAVAERLMAGERKSRILCVDQHGALAGVISLSDIAHNDDYGTTGRLLADVTNREASGA